jgi:hypothetical protein
VKLTDSGRHSVSAPGESSTFHPQWDELAGVQRRLQAGSRFEQWILDARATLSDLFYSEISEGPIVVRLEYADAGIGHSFEAKAMKPRSNPIRVVALASPIPAAQDSWP